MRDPYIPNSPHNDPCPFENSLLHIGIPKTPEEAAWIEFVGDELGPRFLRAFSEGYARKLGHPWHIIELARKYGVDANAMLAAFGFAPREADIVRTVDVAAHALFKAVKWPDE